MPFDPNEAKSAVPASTEVDFETHDEVLMSLKDLRIGDHEVRRQLGSGGMGVVYEAWDCNLQRIDALKLIRNSQGFPTHANHHILTRFQREAQILAQLKHPNIVQIYTARFHEGKAYFVMEYIGGGSLADHHERFTQAGPRAVVAMMRKVADAIHFAHEHGVLHRDLKPSNILLKGDEPRVSDFGLAKYLDDDGAESNSETSPLSEEMLPDPDELTKSGSLSGSPGYMAPEVLNLPTKSSPATDIWSLGVILYELLTGRRFVDAKQDLFQLTDPFVITRKFAVLRKQVGRRLATIAEKCLAENPKDRYQSAAEVSQALLHWERRPVYYKYWLAASLLTLVALVSVQFLNGKPTTPDKAEKANKNRNIN